MISQMPGFGCRAVYGNARTDPGYERRFTRYGDVDIDLPEMSGAEYIRRLQGAGPATKCLVFSICEDDQPLDVFAAPLAPLCPYEKQLNKPPCNGFHRNSDTCPFGPPSHWHLDISEQVPTL